MKVLIWYGLCCVVILCWFCTFVSWELYFQWELYERTDMVEKDFNRLKSFVDVFIKMFYGMLIIPSGVALIKSWANYLEG